MLSQNHFYYGMIRKYIVALHHVVSDIHVLRTENNIVRKDIVVPVTYGTKSKLYNKLTRSISVGDRINTILPRISFIINGMEFEPSRKKNNLNEHRYDNDGETERFIYSGIPYNFNVDMSVWTIYVDDMLQIIEQIATFFKPDYIVTVKEIPELELEKNLPIELRSIMFNIENEYEDTDRMITADLNFVVKGYVYPPISNSTVIKHIMTKMGNLPNEYIQETIKLDWDEIEDKINVSIIDGDTD